MSPQPVSSAVERIPNAFAAACRLARSEGELLERCRAVLVHQFGGEAIVVRTSEGVEAAPAAGAADVAGFVEAARVTSGAAEVLITADPAIAERMQPVAVPLAVALALVLELRGILVGRQTELDDAVFQLRALRQVTRLLSSVHSLDDTQRLITDFMAEVFFAEWAVLYRPRGDQYLAVAERSAPVTPLTLARPALDERLLLDHPAALLGLDGEPTPVDGTRFMAPLEVGSERLAMLLLGPRLDGRPYGTAEVELAATLSYAAAIALKNAELVQQLHSAATTDDLTGLLNRRALEDRLEAELSRALRHQLSTSVLLVDCDRLKIVNDSLGHAAGDRLLVIVSDALRREARALDAVGRLGGDEFLVVLPMTRQDEAQSYVSRVRAALEASGRQFPELAPITVSIGLAEAPKHGHIVPEILAAADAAMYTAKRAGRDGLALAS